MDQKYVIAYTMTVILVLPKNKKTITQPLRNIVDTAAKVLSNIYQIKVSNGNEYLIVYSS